MSKEEVVGKISADCPRDRKRALITGVTGQDRSYLAELLLERGLRCTA